MGAMGAMGAIGCQKRIEYCVREEVLIDVSKVVNGRPRNKVTTMQIKKGAAIYVDEKRIREIGPQAEIKWEE